MKATIIFPHQLFKVHPCVSAHAKCFIVEEYLFFTQYNFHKAKIAFHRASMKAYEAMLLCSGVQVEYIDAQSPTHDVRLLLPWLAQRGYSDVDCCHVSDNYLQARMQSGCHINGITLHWHSSPLFINTAAELAVYANEHKRFFQTTFYIAQRKARQILVENNKPIGGEWSYDALNRKPYPKAKTPPAMQWPIACEYVHQAIDYVAKHFASNIGTVTAQQFYPITHHAAEEHLQYFLRQRLEHFGEFEDAIVENENWLHHSVLTPMLNVGLLTPQQVIDEALLYYMQQPQLPLNSVEGFMRQVLGWREFIRMLYVYKGTYSRTKNYWGFAKKMPASFYNATTGIAPVDIVIKKVLATGYCHHIERLMVLGNFMLLCEIAPDEVYTWFMEMYIDAYDWVMVPNVYGMSQFADGGLFATKPYISSSNYIMKQSNFPKGEWQEIWDALFWRFMHKQRHFFMQNPRLAMLLRTFDKWGDAKKNALLSKAEVFLDNLS